MIRDLVRTKTSHQFRGLDAVTLTLRTVSQADGFSCSVKTPTGAEYVALTRRGLPSGITGGPRTFSVTYPDEFTGAEPFVAGAYLVEWRSDSLHTVGVSPLVAALARATSAPTPEDSFTIPAAPQSPADDESSDNDTQGR